MSAIIRNKRSLALAVFLAVSLTLIGGLFAQEPGEAGPQAGAAGGKIHPGPKNITEKVEICVFLAWVWGVIFLLIFVLRHKIREMDRLYEIRYFSNKGQGNR